MGRPSHGLQINGHKNMIYWFIGQPGCGKTTLAKRLKKLLDAKGVPAIHLDGDDLRQIFAVPYTKENLTKEYRIVQTRCLQRFVAHCANQGVTVIVSTVNPYREIREQFKISRTDMREIYVFTKTPRVRGDFHVKDYEEPLENNIQTIWLDTTELTEADSFTRLTSQLTLI